MSGSRRRKGPEALPQPAAEHAWPGDSRSFHAHRCAALRRLFEIGAELVTAHGMAAPYRLLAPWLQSIGPAGDPASSEERFRSVLAGVAEFAPEIDAERIDREVRLVYERAAHGLPTFEREWAKKEAEGYRYGPDALEGVRLGWEMRDEAEKGGRR